MEFKEGRQPDQSGACQSAQDDCNEDQLSGLHADIEREQRKRNVSLGQADFSQRTGEAKSMQQAKRERDQPGPLRGQARLSPVGSNDLAGQQENTQRNRCFDRRSGCVHNPKCGKAQGDRMCNGKGGDRDQKRPAATHDQDQGQYEQQMVVAQQDVLHTVHQIGGGDLK